MNIFNHMRITRTIKTGPSAYTIEDSLTSSSKCKKATLHVCQRISDTMQFPENTYRHRHRYTHTNKKQTNKETQKRSQYLIVQRYMEVLVISDIRKSQKILNVIFSKRGTGFPVKSYVVLPLPTTECDDFLNT